MNSCKRVALALSGGVDSSVTAYLLKEQGYEVIAFTALMQNNEKNKLMAEQASNIANKLGIKHHIIDFSKQFQKHVIDYFEESYAKGYTPNPCIVCNKIIKWGELFDFAMTNYNADYFATGHYAKIVKENDKYLFYPAEDELKDQLYYLFEIPKTKIEKTLFPLSSYKKDEIKRIGNELGIITPTYKDSQDICFIDPKVGVKRYLTEKFQPQIGDFVEIHSGKKLGEHSGFYQFTIGQRKGIGIAYKEPLYVVKIDSEKNIVYLGVKDDLYLGEIKVENINFHDRPENNNFEAFVKVRYNMPYKKAEIFLDGNNALVKFAEPISAITQGQAVVFYNIKTKHLLGGAWL